MEHVLLVLLQLLFMGFVVLPLLIGIVAAVRCLRAGSTGGFVKHLCGSIAAGAVMLGLLWSSLFGDNLSKSSTAGLIFAVAPFYGAAAQAVVYGILSLFLKTPARPGKTPSLAWIALLIPASMLATVMAGMFNTAQFKEPDYDVAARTSEPATIARLMAKTRIEGQEAFMIAIRLAGNAATPPGMLSELAQDDHPAVRYYVVKNPRTPLEVVAPLHYDCSSVVRKAVVERLGPNNSFAPAPAPTGKCEYDKWR